MNRALLGTPFELLRVAAPMHVPAGAGSLTDMIACRSIPERRAPGEDRRRPRQGQEALGLLRGLQPHRDALGRCSPYAPTPHACLTRQFLNLMFLNLLARVD